MWDAADIADLIDPDLPGYTLGTKDDASTVGGLFRAPGVDAFSGMVAGLTPSFVCAENAAPPIGGGLSISGKDYTVTRRRPTGQGFVTLEMDEA